MSFMTEFLHLGVVFELLTLEIMEAQLKLFVQVDRFRFFELFLSLHHFSDSENCGAAGAL